MTQDYSSQKLYGFSFIKQSLALSNFELSTTGQHWFANLLFHLGLLVAAFVSGILSGFSIYSIVFSLDLLLTDSVTDWSHVDSRVLPILLLTNIGFAYVLFKSAQQDKLNQFLNFIILSSLVSIGAFGVGAAIMGYSTAGTISGAISMAVAGGFAGISTTIMLVATSAIISKNSNILVVAVMCIAITISMLIATNIDVLVAASPLFISFLAICLVLQQKINQQSQEVIYLRTLSLKLAALGNTRFDQADLTKASFHQADLKHASFSDTTLIHTNFYQAKNLQLAYVKNTILSQKIVRDLLIDGKTNITDFAGMNLKGAYLQEADVQTIDFTDANFYQADFSGANLRNANLTRVQAIGSNFENADLTGACLEAWNIDSTTNIKNVRADYVYLQNNQQQRCPSSGTFSAGEFSQLFQQLFGTVDFIFKQGTFSFQCLSETLHSL